MRAKLASPLAETAAGAIAEAVLRSCVHCGMCNAVCPTYQLTGDELDGPRGRIYLMKLALEGEPVGAVTQGHLDACLSCRACESACPSGVEYHRLLDVGREAVAASVPRPWPQRLLRAAIRGVATRPALMRPLFWLARALRLMPPLPSAHPGESRDPAPRRMAVLGGCVQTAAAGHFNAAAGRVFDRIGVTLAESAGVGCCGALAFHLDAQDQARALARRNIDAWARDLDAGAEAIVVTASGCAAHIQGYPDLLAGEPAYAETALRVAAAVREPIELLDVSAFAADRPPPRPAIAVHEPCTLQHGLKLTGRIAAFLTRLGYAPQPVADNHLCCGSAGAYSLLQPKLARPLRAAKLAALTAGAPAAIVTANIGCWLYLAPTSPVPVRHWLEAVDDLIDRRT
jgi:glycolate oxidase iron-sulfur subunit